MREWPCATFFPLTLLHGVFQLKFKSGKGLQWTVLTKSFRTTTKTNNENSVSHPSFITKSSIRIDNNIIILNYFNYNVNR